MTPQARSELERLTSALCEGAIGDDDFSRLEMLLRGDAANRRFYLQYVDLHARLMQHPGLAADSLTAAATALKPRAPAWRSYAATALATLAASLLLQFVLRKPTTADASMKSPAHPALSYVATLTKACHCQWEGDERRAAMRLMPGELRLASGRAVVHFDAGAELVLEGPAVVNIDSATSATLRQGKVLFRDDNSAEPFDLQTPQARLVDYGTEYAVSVGPVGEEIHVFDGEVVRTPNVEADEQLAAVSVTAGEARRFTSATDAAGSPVPLDVSGYRISPPATTAAAANPLEGLIAYDSFDYQTRQIPALDAVENGSGWASPWSYLPQHTGDSYFRCILGLRRFPRTATEDVGSGLSATRRVAMMRRLTEPLDMDRDGAYYFGILLRAEPPKAGRPCDVQLVLRNSGINDPKGRLFVTVSWANSSLSLGWAGGGTTASLPLETGRTHLLVGKIAADDHEPDQAFLRLFDSKTPMPTEEPTSWTVAARPIMSSRRFDTVQLSTNTSTQIAIDEMRFGATWNAVAAPYQASALIKPLP